MEVSLKKTDDLNGIITICISGKDYQEKVDLALKRYKKNAKMPGFRNGKIPKGLIKKMYGKAAIVDEVNKLLQNTLMEYIAKEKLDLLGNPLPQESQDIDWDNSQDFIFNYDVGFVPNFKASITSKDKLLNYKIEADKNYVNRIVEDLSMRFGKFSEPNIISKENRVFARFIELENDLKKEGGVSHENYIQINSLEEKSQKKIIGLKKDDEVIVDILNLFTDQNKLSHLLNINEEELKNISRFFKIIVISITKIEPAKVNQDLFDKVYGKKTVSDEKTFKQKIKDEAEKTFERDSNNKLLNDAREYLIVKNKIDLPDEFLKRWLISINEKKVSKEQLEKDYPKYIDGLKLQLIEGSLMKENNIKIEKTDIDVFANQAIRAQMAQYGQQNPSNEEVNKLVKKVLEKEEERDRIIDYVRSEKLHHFYKKKFNLQEKKISFDEFSKLVSKK